MRRDRTHDDLADLAIIIVSTNEAHWLEPCLSTVFAHAGDATLDVVVVDNESTDGTRELVESQFPAGARRRLRRTAASPTPTTAARTTCAARYVLFLNPDTEIVDGTFGELVAALDERPEVGLAGVKQITADGTLWPTIRHFPSVPARPRRGLRLRALAARGRLGRASASSTWTVYEREVDCDWTSGSFMLARREALLSAGLLDERFFIYSEEPDLCLRMKRAGWAIRHLPAMTIVHHAGKGGLRPKMIAQDAYTRRQYAHKHLTPVRRLMYLSALGLRQLLRATGARATGSEAGDRREGAKRALDALAGRGDPPFGTPPATAVTLTPASWSHFLRRRRCSPLRISGPRVCSSRLAWVRSCCSSLW